DLVAESHGVVFQRNLALTLVVVKHVVRPDAEFSGAFAWGDDDGGRDEDPVEGGFLLEQVIELARAADPGFERFVGGGKVGRMKQRDAGGSLRAGGSAYPQEALRSRFLPRGEDGLMPVHVEIVDMRARHASRGIEGADNDIVAREDFRKFVNLMNVR